MEIQEVTPKQYVKMIADRKGMRMYEVAALMGKSACNISLCMKNPRARLIIEILAKLDEDFIIMDASTQKRYKLVNAEKKTKRKKTEVQWS